MFRHDPMTTISSCDSNEYKKTGIEINKRNSKNALNNREKDKGIYMMRKHIKIWRDKEGNRKRKTRATKKK